MTYRNYYTGRARGFTLIELLVSVAIITMVSAIVMYNYRGFNNELSIRAAAQEMAIAARQAQTYGLSVKEVVKGGGDFSTGYGIYFNTDNPTAYYIFADKNHNNVYDGDTACSSGTECVEKMVLRNNVSIIGLCGTYVSGTVNCPPLPPTNALSIVFLRPNPDAVISFIKFNGNIVPGTFQSAAIQLNLTGAGAAGQSTVSIDATGRIGVQ